MGVALNDASCEGQQPCLEEASQFEQPSVGLGLRGVLQQQHSDQGMGAHEEIGQCGENVANAEAKMVGHSCGNT